MKRKLAITVALILAYMSFGSCGIPSTTSKTLGSVTPTSEKWVLQAGLWEGDVYINASLGFKLEKSTHFQKATDEQLKSSFGESSVPRPDSKNILTQPICVHFMVANLADAEQIILETDNVGTHPLIKDYNEEQYLDLVLSKQKEALTGFSFSSSSKIEIAGEQYSVRQAKHDTQPIYISMVTRKKIPLLFCLCLRAKRRISVA